jgi:hypothetical protein
MNQTPNDHPHDLISAYADGEIDAPGRAAVERHLRACDGCRRLFDDIRSLVSAVAAEEPPPVPSDLAARIRLRLPAAAPAERRPLARPWWWSPLPLSAAAAILVGGALFLASYEARRASREEPLVARGTTSSQASPEAPPSIVAKKAKAEEQPQPSSEFAPAPAEDAGPGIEPRRQDDAIEEPGPLQEKDETRQVGERVAPQSAAVRSGAAESKAAPSAPDLTAISKEQLEGKFRALRAQEGSRGGSAADAAGQGAEVSPGLAASSQTAVRPGGRVLVLTTPLYEAEILETGTLTLKAQGYSCVQDLGWLESAGDATADALPENRPPDPMAPRHLFGLASSADFMTAPDSPAARGETGGSVPRTAASRLVLLDGERKVLHAVTFGAPDDRGSAPVVREIAHRIDQLVRERLRPGLERDCGPLPSGLR